MHYRIGLFVHSVMAVILLTLALTGTASAHVSASSLVTARASRSQQMTNFASVGYQKASSCSWVTMASQTTNLRKTTGYIMNVSLQQQSYPCDQRQVRISFCLSTPANNRYDEFMFWLEFYENSSYTPPSDHVYISGIPRNQPAYGICGTGPSRSIPAGTDVTGAVEIIAVPSTTPTRIGEALVEDRL